MRAMEAIVICTRQPYHETNAQGLGVMYRILDVRALIGALRDCTFGDLNATVRVDVGDAFSGGKRRLVAHLLSRRSARTRGRGNGSDVDLAIGVADFSSLMLGAVRLRSLVAYGNAVLSDQRWLARLDAAFDAEPPQCLTRF